MEKDEDRAEVNGIETTTSLNLAEFIILILYAMHTQGPYSYFRNFKNDFNKNQILFLFFYLLIIVIIFFYSFLN